ncbi:hypothetical protein P7C70_g2328, partial [Phenoliferia sp. Uapishka_3]
MPKKLFAVSLFRKRRPRIVEPRPGSRVAFRRHPRVWPLLLTLRAHHQQPNTTMSVVSAKRVNPILAAYLRSLAENPLATKAVTTGVLSFFQELLAGKLAGSPPEELSKAQRTGLPPVDWIKKNHRAVKLAIYGFFVAAPLAHTLTGRLQKAFAGKTAPKDRIMMIVVQYLLLSPIQNTAYIAGLAVIAGATSLAQIRGAIRENFLRIMKISWAIGPLSMVIAQKFLPTELWVPFFTTIGAAAGTVVNMQVRNPVGKLIRIDSSDLKLEVLQVKKKALISKAQAQAKRDAEASAGPK